MKLDVFLVNGYKITVEISSTDQTEDVLEVKIIVVHLLLLLNVWDVLDI